MEIAATTQTPWDFEAHAVAVFGAVGTAVPLADLGFSVPRAVIPEPPGPATKDNLNREPRGDGAKHEETHNTCRDAGKSL